MRYPDPRRHPAKPASSGTRVFTLPLTLFLAVLVGVAAAGLLPRIARPDVADAVRILADGDLEGAGRKRMLRIVVDGALRSDDPSHRWAGMLAAVALDDRLAYAAARAPLGGTSTPRVLPPAPDRRLLHMGDPLLANLCRAMLAEAEGDRPQAAKAWRQVATQCRLIARPFAAELAAAALTRLS